MQKTKKTCTSTNQPIRLQDSAAPTTMMQRVNTLLELADKIKIQTDEINGLLFGFPLEDNGSPCGPTVFERMQALETTLFLVNSRLASIRENIG